MDIRASDGYVLKGTHYEGGDHAIVIAGAMGVARRFYDGFASHLAANGKSVVTFDYRGIADSKPPSLRKFGGSLSDWGKLDLPAVIDWTLRELKPARISLVGHSCGGQIVGLAPNADVLDRLAFVCAQSGYWRLWPAPRRYALGFLWLVMPAVARTLGFFPSRLFRLGNQDLPREVAAQWATAGRHPDYIFGFHDDAAYRALTAPILAWSFAEDTYAPKPAVEALLRHYASAPIEHRHVDGRRVGHWGFFRKGSDELWRETLGHLSGAPPTQ
jgi:predicted alpha/beta hydrolase